jgi:uncharacterized protein YbjQ (UPF0145 family)
LRSVEDSFADSGENGGPLHCAGQETQRATVKNKQTRKLRIYHEWMDQQLPAVDIHMVTTAFTLDGYRIERNLGIVRGIIVRSRSILGTVGASLQTLVGGDITLFSNLCEETRAHAYQRMAQHAAQMGANGIIGVRYDATEIMQGVTEVLCYGTAVIAKPA